MTKLLLVLECINMKIIAELTEKSVGSGDWEFQQDSYFVRRCARAVIVRSDKKVCIQEIKSRGYWKLPGGGIDPGESAEEALRRELREEVGCEIDQIKEIGSVLEYRTQLRSMRVSFLYTCKLNEEMFPAKLTEREINEGLENHWMDPEDAVEKVMNQKMDYLGRFVQARAMLGLRAIIK